jgi:uncharacterized protein involved in exopolysaccharide biosynthesis
MTLLITSNSICNDIPNILLKLTFNTNKSVVSDMHNISNSSNLLHKVVRELNILNMDNTKLDEGISPT